MFFQIPLLTVDDLPLIDEGAINRMVLTKSILQITECSQSSRFGGGPPYPL
jgi:hypothetical protein